MKTSQKDKTGLKNKILFPKIPSLEVPRTILLPACVTEIELLFANVFYFKFLSS
jgi:hypothetical protein